jgi:hypothetical protein
MRNTAKIGAIVAAGALAVAVPAAAHTGQSSKSHNCVTRNVAYIAHGTVSSWSATQTGTPTGRWDGSITLNVKSTNHHVTKGTTTFTLLNTKVRLGKGVTDPGIGDRVSLIGKIAVAPTDPKCTSSNTTGTAAGTITVRKVDLSAPKHTK